MLSVEIIYHHFDILASTNGWAKAHFETFPKNAMTLITADSQSAGRGQYGRRWLSPKGVNIYATFAFFADKVQEPLTLTRQLALSAAAVLKEYGVTAELKWPNDLLVNQKKIAGILCEAVPFLHQIGIAIGIGLNVNMPQEMLEQINQPATSLLVETGRVYRLNEVLDKLKDHFVKNLIL